MAMFDDDYSSFNSSEPKKEKKPKKPKEEKRAVNLPSDFGAVLAGIDGRSDEKAGQLEVAAGADIAIFSAEKPKEKISQTFDQLANINELAHQIGEVVEGKGVYQGTWLPRRNYDDYGDDGFRVPYGKVFDLYAAPEDIQKILASGSCLMTFNDAADDVAALSNWHDHDGAKLKTEVDVLSAVEDDPMRLSGWFIPTKEMLNGCCRSGPHTNYNLYDNMDEMPEETKPMTRVDRHYWSCVTTSSNIGACSVELKLGTIKWNAVDVETCSTRPFRAELRF